MGRSGAAAVWQFIRQLLSSLMPGDQGGARNARPPLPHSLSFQHTIPDGGHNGLYAGYQHKRQFFRNLYLLHEVYVRVIVQAVIVNELPMRSVLGSVAALRSF